MEKVLFFDFTTNMYEEDDNAIYVQLKKAVVRGDVKRVKYLLASGINANFKTVDSGDTLLHLSSNAEITKELLLHGANVYLKNGKRKTALEIAVYESKDLGLIKALITGGANVYAIVPYEGNTLLHMCKSAQVAKLLWEYGLNIHQKNRRGETPLGKAIHEEKELELIKLLIYYGSTFSVSEILMATPALKNSAEIMELLLSAGADSDATTSETTLPAAATGGNDVEMVKMPPNAGGKC